MLSILFSRLTAASNSLIHRHLEWIYRVTSRSPRKIAASALVLTALALGVISTVRFEADIFRLFPSRLPALRLLLDSLDWSGSAKEAYFLIEGEPSRLPVETEKLVQRLKDLRIDGKPAFARVTWRLYDETEGRLFVDFIAYAVTRPQFFVAPGDASRLAQRLDPAGFDASLMRLEAELAGQFAGSMTALVSADPLNLRELILPRIKAGSQALDLDPSSPYFLSRDGQVMIVIAEPARPVQDVVFARRLVTGINEARAGLDARVSCAGAHVSAVMDEAEMKSNIISCILSSLLVVLAMFYFVYRRLLPTILLPLIIAVGVILALATASFFLASIHIISFAFMALIIGLGTDYSIHLYDRYHCERALGKSPDEALHLAVVDTGHGLFTAAATTALPFLALLVSDVRALYELGFLVGLGVMYSLYATLFFLPPLLVFMERRFPRPFRPIPALGMRSVWRLTGRHPRVVAGVSLLVAAGLAVASLQVKFDGELKNLQPRHSEAFLTQEKIEKHLSLAPDSLMVAIEGPELADVLARSGRVGELAERNRTEGRIVEWSSLGRVINNRSEQEQLVSALRAAAGGGTELGAKLRSALDRRGFDAESFQPAIDALAGFETAAEAPETEAIKRLLASPLRGVVNRHLVQDASGYHALVFLYYRGAAFDQGGFLKELTAIDPSARVTSVDLVSSQLAESVSRSFMWSFIIGGLLVLFLLLSHFSSRAGLFYTMFPVAAGAVGMLGVMAISGMGINFMNAMVLVTIVGMGSDYGMHMWHRLEGAEEGQEERFVQAGRAVLLSALTTIAGFGSLAFADYPALSSIGWATNLGIGFTALFALVTLPAVAALFRRGKSANNS